MRLNTFFRFGSTLFLSVFLFSGIYAQETSQSNKSISLRGKAFSFFIIEDIFFQNWNIGAEYRFAEKHSLGIDFVHFRWRYEYDIYINNMETGFGPDAFSRRRYLLADYRYYPFPNLMQKRFIDPYFNPFVKVGERKIWTNDPTQFYAEDDIPTVKNHRANFTDFGLALGLKWDFKNSGRFGWDVNIGAVFRETRVRYEQRYNYNTASYSEHYFRKYHNWHPHMRLNFYFKIIKLK